MSKYRDLAVKTTEGLGFECDEDDESMTIDFWASVDLIQEALQQVERETWEAAANVVRNQQGVSHWTDDDTIELLMSKAGEESCHKNTPEIMTTSDEDKRDG